MLAEVRNKLSFKENEIDEELWIRYNNNVELLSEISKQKVQGAIIRTKIERTEKVEKNNVYFPGLEK